MKRLIVFATMTCLSVALATAVPVTAVLAADDITQMIANAKTAADHEAIAAYYDKEAAAAKDSADLHRKMLEVIKARGGGPDIAKWHMDSHCEALIKAFESSVKNYAAMAHAHREMAKAVK